MGVSESVGLPDFQKTCCFQYVCDTFVFSDWSSKFWLEDPVSIADRPRITLNKINFP